LYPDLLGRNRWLAVPRVQDPDNPCRHRTAPNVLFDIFYCNFFWMF
jgi:hypothetical protein